MTNVIEFDPLRRFIRPCAVLDRNGFFADGKPAFVIQYLFHEHDGGGELGIWFGGSYDQALDELLNLQKRGTKVYETVGGAR